MESEKASMHDSLVRSKLSENERILAATAVERTLRSRSFEFSNSRTGPAPEKQGRRQARPAGQKAVKGRGSPFE